MTSRRSFLASAALLSAGLLVSPSLLAYNKRYVGLQLYTVRDAMEKDPAGTLAKLAKIGYNSVEGATYTGSQKFYGMTPQAFAALLKQNGLIMPSSHYRLGEEQMKGEAVQGTILHGWDKAVDDAAAAGVKYMVCAYLSEAERGNLEHYKYIAEQLNKAGERCQKAGIQLCYHNHDFEFKAQDGKLPYDLLLTGTDKKLVQMELDLYWVTKAGHDPLALFKQHPGRFPLWHVKDMDKTPQKAFTEVGNGSIDFKKIFAHADEAGLKYFFVEQDSTPGSPFDSVTKSINYIKKNLV
ncbi:MULTISPECIES: sugar phosphate isomerase/epimerase family protein [Hymenobacter]|uniref:Sugar phosphate isomerase/epimerase n=1 Tax=Hymenobacter jejuensis TaxID=2502781 RepID=A0A5B8A2F6_9BACT|nr:MULTISPECIES: sugar phosphate isomerase/epimerase [Hymenobacter]MBC6989555.1 sugar phosphate isomerase/epimerase [Hymenobacter sp. BT491]QDA61574.1 sugar phosphate isomerase/epimerase [Hymenobacter jejuensis]